MPGKSRRSKIKRSLQQKKGKVGISRPTIPAQPPETAQTQEPAPRPRVPAPSARVPTSTAKPAALRNVYVTTELRNIGILAGIMLVVLIVLSLVLS